MIDAILAFMLGYGTVMAVWWFIAMIAIHIECSKSEK